MENILVVGVLALFLSFGGTIWYFDHKVETLEATNSQLTATNKQLVDATNETNSKLAAANTQLVASENAMTTLSSALTQARLHTTEKIVTIEKFKSDSSCVDSMNFLATRGGIK